MYAKEIIMKTLSFVTQKGGAGKTTLAISLAMAAREAGETVILLDLDPQESLLSWGQHRDYRAREEDRETGIPAVDRIRADQLPNLQGILDALAKKGFTLAILDTAGKSGTSEHMAMECSHLCLLPTRPARFDVRSTKATYEAAIRMERRFLFILNQCPANKRNQRTEQVREVFETIGLDVATPSIVQRTDHQDAIASGLSVTEYNAKGKAAAEIRALWAYVNEKMNALEEK